MLAFPWVVVVVCANGPDRISIISQKLRKFERRTLRFPHSVHLLNVPEYVPFSWRISSPNLPGSARTVPSDEFLGHHGRFRKTGTELSTTGLCDESETLNRRRMDFRCASQWSVSRTVEFRDRWRDVKQRDHKEVRSTSATGKRSPSKVRWSCAAGLISPASRCHWACRWQRQ